MNKGMVWITLVRFMPASGSFFAGLLMICTVTMPGKPCCAAYNVQAAIDYANYWCDKRNPAYHDYSNEGGDCANFVSQCLIAGGFLSSP